MKKKPESKLALRPLKIRELSHNHLETVRGGWGTVIGCAGGTGGDDGIGP
jgi:hypothetical protein